MADKSPYDQAKEAHDKANQPAPKAPEASAEDHSKDETGGFFETLAGMVKDKANTAGIEAPVDMSKETLFETKE